MKEKTKKILLKVPKSTNIYVFGSMLSSLAPKDLDILVVFNPKIYPGATIYKTCEELTNALFEVFKLEVDLTVLSYTENNEMNFIKEVKAIKLKDFLQNLLHLGI